MRPVNAFMNGASLRDADPRILVRSVSDGGTQREMTWGDNPGRSGQRLLGSRAVSRRLSVSFAIRELHDLAARAAALDAVNAWAQDGYLEFSNRPGQRIRVACAGFAYVADPRSYTEEFSISFDATPDPYWESKFPAAVSLAGSSGSGQITNLGNAPTKSTFTVTPTGGTLNTLTLILGGKQMAFTGLGVAANTPLTIGYDDLGYQLIGTASASKLGSRTAASADELIAPPGVSAVSFTANTACNVSIEVRSKWK